MGVRSAKHGGLVTVKCLWPAVALQVGTGGLEIAAGRFRIREVQMHQPAGGVIDIDHQGAGRPAVLEPRMVAAIDLDQLANTVPAVTRLINLCRALPTRNPQSGLRHQPPHRLCCNAHAVDFAQLLAGQRRSKVAVPVPDQRQGLIG